MADKRIFIGFDIASKARQRAEEHIQQLRKSTPDVRVGWEKPEKLHITLKFLGGVDEAKIPLISRALDEIAAVYEPVAIELGGTGVFPNTRQPRILWVGIKSTTSQLSAIASSVEKGCSALGFAADERAFKPHLTIARIREPQKGRALAALHLGSGFPPVGFTVSEIVVYESKLGPGGSVYTVLYKSRLRSS